MYDLIIFTAYLMTFIQMGLGLELGLRLGDIRESGETGDSREEEDTRKSGYLCGNSEICE